MTDSIETTENEAQGFATPQSLITQAIARAWCVQPNTNKPIDIELAEAATEQVMAALTPSVAIDILKRAFKADEGFAWTWHCGVWAAAHDVGGLSGTAANKVAAAFMRNAFDVDTETFANMVEKGLPTSSSERLAKLIDEHIDGQLGGSLIAEPNMEAEGYAMALRDVHQQVLQLAGDKATLFDVLLIVARLGNMIERIDDSKLAQPATDPKLVPLIEQQLGTRFRYQPTDGQVWVLLNRADAGLVAHWPGTSIGLQSICSAAESASEFRELLVEVVA